MNNSRNSIDYVVSKKPSGANILARIGLIILYLAIFIVPLAMLAKSRLGILGIVAGGVIAPILTYIVFSLTWRHVSYDHRYQIYTPTASLNDQAPHTVFRLDRMKRNNKKEIVPMFVFMAEMRNAKVIAPYVPENASRYSGDGVSRTIDFRSSPNVTSDCYFLRFPESAGMVDETNRFENHMKGDKAAKNVQNPNGDVVIIVEAVNKIVDSFKHFAPDVTEVTALSR